MEYTIGLVNNWDEDKFHLAITGPSREEVKKIREVLDDILGVNLPKVSDPDYNIGYLSVEDISRDTLEAWKQSAKWYYQVDPNKIMTIKHVRKISGGSHKILDLKAAKELAEYAIHGESNRPVWWK